MKDKNQDRNKGGQGNRDTNIGNKQRTTQTGGQNVGGQNRDQRGDEFSEDLRKSGNRKGRSDEGGRS